MALYLGLNLEFARAHDLSSRRAVDEASAMGYRFVEPMVHLGRQLLAEGGFLHSISLSEDPLAFRDYCREHDVGISAVSSHAQLCRPDVAIEYLRQGIRWAAEMGVGVVCTSEGFKTPWTTEEEDMTLIKYGLKVCTDEAARRGIVVGLEPHHQYSGSLEGMDRILSLVDTPALGVNFDTGNALLAGRSDIYSWLEHVLPRLVHLHAKDISARKSDAEKGKVFGTATGCACGDGVVDWERVVGILRKADQDIVLSVECGNREEAAKSYRTLRPLVDG